MMLVATACGGSDSGSGGGDAAKNDTKAAAGSGASASPSAVPKAQVTVTPKNGASGVRTSGVLKVSAARGTLTSVVVKDAKGNKVDGAIADGGTGWEPSGTLAAATTYTVDATAKDSAGQKSTKHSTFTTVTPKGTFLGYYTPENGQTVGTGMEVSLNFTRAITDKKAVEKAVKVTADPSVDVVGHWYGNQRIDFRPKEYWAAGTKVTLSLRLNGVEGASGIYGTQSKDVHFTVGRSQVSIVDAAAHTMKVYRSGKLLRTIPITSGAPGKTTYNGKMVITEKYVTKRMNGDTVGYEGEYDIPDVPHAMRLTNSGTFVHGNYWASASTFGSANVSHGCVGLRDVKGAGDSSTPAAWFYASSIIGDVVQVKNSNDKTVAWYNGLNGWNMSWSDWTAAG
jgi:lipoprotein-anchoring transpeptidase ErfK/SrfK